MTNAKFLVLVLLFQCASIYSAPVTSKVGEMDGGLVNYDDVVEAQKDDKILIIDIRENSEIQETGQLPGSIHIPMKQLLTELNLPSEEFDQKYGKKKPTLDSKIILSCRSGRRSKIAQGELQKSGYTNVFSYSGGWLDWEKHQKN